MSITVDLTREIPWESPVTSGSVAEDKCQAMEYLTEAHVALARRHLQEIQGRITELKDAAAKHSSLPPDALLSPGRWAI